jgi:hypothetical protein
MEQPRGFGNELMLVGAMSNKVLTLVNKVGRFLNGGVIGGEAYKVGTGNEVNLLISAVLNNPVKPTWFGFGMGWNYADLSRDDQEEWPQYLPIGSTVYSVSKTDFSAPIVDTVANTGGWPNTQQKNMSYEVINLLDIASNAVAMGALYQGIVWPITALADNIKFIFQVQPGGYIFHEEDYLAIYALPGIST